MSGGREGWGGQGGVGERWGGREDKKGVREMWSGKRGREGWRDGRMGKGVGGGGERGEGNGMVG